MRHCTQCGAATPEDARFCPKCGAPVATTGSGDPMLGKVIADRYLLVEKIGQGGSGTIYRGEHTTLRKRVAVKVLHAQLSTDDTALERFRREATTVAELDNDHILQVIDFGRTEDNRLFFAMEYLEGETLTKVLERDKQLAIPRAIDILTQIIEALTEAHGLGYVHRDLRPRNVFLINKRGRADFVKLLDFGLAKLVLPNAEAKHTAMGMTFGDPRYMSPEQARGEALDRRSDIYSLGAVAYEMLTGGPPYHGSGTFEILQQHLDAPVPRVRDKRTDCPEWLDALVQRALAKQPDGRFVTVLKMLELLRAQQPPTAVDAAEKAEHARLSSQRPAQSTAPPAPAPVQSMGPPAPTPTPAPAAEAKPPSPRDTQAFSSRPQKTAQQAAPAVMASKSEKAAAKPAKAEPPKAEPPKVEPPKSEPKKPAVATPAAASGSVDVTPPALKAPLAATNVPSVVVESGSQEKTMPAKLPAASAAAPVFDERPTMEKPFAAPLPPPPESTPPPRRKDPTGEWFSSDSQPMRTIPGATYDDDLDEVPKKNRGPLIILGVSGSLLLIFLIVIALLPKPEHKPLRGEQPATPPASEPPKTAQAEPPAPAPSGVATPPVAEPSGAAAAPSGIAAAPSAATPSGASVAPSGAALAASGTAAKPSGVAVPPSNVAAAPSSVSAPSSGVAAHPAAPPSGVAAAKPSPPPAVAVKPTPAPPPPKTVAVEKPAKEPTARVEKVEKEKPPIEKPAKPAVEKPTRVAAAEKPTRVAAAEKPAPADKRKRDKGVPEGFKDPFNEPKATAPSASESAQAEFFVKLGRQKLNASDLTSAAANFNKAREYDSRSAEAVAGLGEVAFEQGDYSGAAVHLKQALRLSPNRSRYLVLLGQTYYKLGKPKEAVGEYKRALRIDPNNQEAQHSLEVAERKLGSGG
jgi:serine/threonine protein kinase